MRRLHDSEQTVQKLRNTLFELLSEKEYIQIESIEVFL